MHNSHDNKTHPTRRHHPSRTSNTPIKDITAVAEAQPTWKGVIDKLTDGGQLPFLEELAKKKTLG